MLSIGIHNAKVEVDGARHEGGKLEKVALEFKETEGKLKYFEDIDEDIAKWTYIYLKVTKL